MVETVKSVDIFSDEAERAVLGAVFVEPSLFHTVSARLQVEDFYLARHRKIYAAMIEVVNKGSPIDIITVQSVLEEKQELQNVGGVAYLAALDTFLPDITRIEAYIDIVKERALRRRVILTCQKIIEGCRSGDFSAQTALAVAEKEILLLGEEAVSKNFIHIGELVDKVLDELEEKTKKGSYAPLAGLPTGFYDLDTLTHGLIPSNLVVLAGRPGMGKTSLAINIAQYLTIVEDKPIAFFSLEMSANEIFYRVLSSESEVPLSKLRSGNLSHEMWESIEKISERIKQAPFYIDDTPSLSLFELASKSRKLRYEKGIELVIIDYLQLMHAGGKFENRNLEISAISRGLKQLAKELNIPVVALSQLSRQPEKRGKDKRPQLSDLRESGSIEQDADIVLFVYRPEVYETNEEKRRNLEGQGEIIIAKHRNGPLATVKVAFIKQISTFKNIAPDYYF